MKKIEPLGRGRLLAKGQAVRGSLSALGWAVLLLLAIPGRLWALDYQFTSQNGQVTITKYQGPGGNVLIPSTINGQPVTRIADDAFAGSGLAGVTIPASVSRIGVRAFANCTNLFAVNSFGGVTSIDSATFSNCTRLTSLVIPSGVTNIGAGAFADCRHLISATIPSSVTRLGAGAFNNCSSMVDAWFNGSAPAVGAGVFDGTPATIYYLTGTWGATFCGRPTAVNQAENYFGVSPNGDGTCTITYYSYSAPQSGDVIIPDTIHGMLVTAIDDGDDFPRYFFPPSLTSVTMPAGLTRVGFWTIWYSPTKAIYFKGSRPVITKSSPYRTYGGWNFMPGPDAVYYLPGATGWDSTLDGIPAVQFDYAAANGGATITGYEGSGAAVTVPDRLYGLPVVALGEAVFAQRASMTQISIPETIRTFGRNLFMGCSALTSVTIPTNVTSIEAGTFANCSNLTCVTIPLGVTNLGDAAFANCTSLQSLLFPSDAPCLGGASVFAGAIALTNYFLTGTSGWDATFGDRPAVALQVPDYLYTDLDDEIIITRYTGLDFCAQIPATIGGRPVTGIGAGAFANCTSLWEIDYPAGIKTIGPEAFSGCSTLIRLKPWYDYAYWTDAYWWNRNYWGLLWIPATTTSIGDGAFRDCGRFSSVRFHTSVTNLGNEAFWGCAGLTNIEIPASVRSLGTDAFGACTRLGAITVADDNPNYCSVNGVLLSKDQATLLQYPAGQPNSYAIPASVRTLAVGAFDGCDQLANVLIGANLVSIGERAFFQCSNLTNLLFQGDAPVLEGAAVFDGANSATIYRLAGASGWPVTPATYGGRPIVTVQVPDYTYTTANGQIAITGYTGTNRTAIIPDTVGGLPVTSIGANAFAGQTSLVNVIIPASITELGDNAFAFCTNLTGAYFLGPPPLEGVNSFQGDNQMTVYHQYNWWWNPSDWGSTFGSRPVAIFPYGFSVNADHTVTITSYSGMDSELDIPSTIADIAVTGIGALAFSSYMRDNPWALTRVSIPYGVCVIGQEAFAGNNSLTNVTIPDSVSEIGAWAFSGCQKLSLVMIGASLTSLGQSAFAGCSSLMEILVSSSNLSFCSVNGVLFNRDQTVLVWYPGGRTGAYTVPDGVTDIAPLAFSDSSGLLVITIPDCVQSIGDNAFRAANLKSIYFNGNAPNVVGANSFSGDSTIYYMPGATGWGDSLGGRPARALPYSFTRDRGGIVITGYHGVGGRLCVPNSLAGLPVTCIGRRAFYGADITSVVLADGVTNMGCFAFANCTNLMGAAIGKGMATLGPGTFDGCVRLSSVSMGADLPYVPEGMFQSCVSLLEVSLPASVTTIGAGAFCGCTNLVSLEKPAGITNIGYRAFYFCSSLRE